MLTISQNYWNWISWLPICETFDVPIHHQKNSASALQWLLVQNVSDAWDAIIRLTCNRMVLWIIDYTVSHSIDLIFISVIQYWN